MALTFTRALTVEPGGAITSRQMVSLARAIKDRERSGIGDWAWRKAMLWFNLFRLPLNPDGASWYSQGVFFEAFQHVAPELGYNWPLNSPGEPNGAALSNVMMQFVFGLAPYLYSEPGRLEAGLDEDGNPVGLPMWIGNGPPETPAEWWEMGKQQRGAIDPASGAQFVPALETAQKFFEIVTPQYSPHGKAYGGFFPSPIELLPNCGATEETGLFVQSYQYFFTALNAAVSTAGFHGSVSTVNGVPRITYAGSCPLLTDNTAAGHVVYIAPLPFAWYVAVNDGAGNVVWDRFDRTEWILGPFEGIGVLSREDSGLLHRAIWMFAAEFRGSREQRAEDNFSIEEIAFEFQAFAEQQYHLSPNIARFSGGQLEAVYPLFRLTGATTFAKGQVFTFLGESGGTTHQYADGFVLSACHVSATRLVSATTVELVDDGSVIASIKLEPDPNNSNQASALFTFKTARTSPNLSVRLGSAVEFQSATGKIEVECNEIAEYKGNWWDFYLMLRMSATGGGDLESAGVDGGGLDCTFSRAIWDNYQANACITNLVSPGPRGQADWVTDNPVFEAARRLSREQVRVLSRQQFRSYAVENGKSVVRFYRHVRGVMGLPEDAVDCFESIAPSKTAVEPGELVRGEEYIVRGTSGNVTYKGASFGPEQRFIADGASFFSATGDCQVFVWNGIRHMAFPKGWTNEWAMFIETKAYRPNVESEFKPEAFADFFTFHNRCMFLNQGPANGAFTRHITYNNRTMVVGNEDNSQFSTLLQSARASNDFLTPEGPSGYNYAINFNSTFVTADFYRSCQIYKAPYEVDEAVIEFADGIEIVKLTFNGRFQFDPAAPASVAADASAWNSAEVTALHDTELYRTDDNALREYARHQADAAYQPSWKVGDAAVYNTAGVRDLRGSVYPHFFFVRLMEEPYEDGNDRIQDTDARCTIDAMLHAEVAIRAGCEGFIDDATSLAVTCEAGEGGLFDYRFSNLCFDAFGGAYIGAFALTLRPDNPSGFGPLPNTLMYAEVFNRLSSCVNLLTRARVMLPFHVECKSTLYEGDQAVTPDWPTNPQPGCVSGCGPYAVLWQGCPPAANNLISESEWGNCGLSVTTQSSGGINTYECPVEGGPQFYVTTNRTVVDYRVLVDGDAYLAVPVAWRDQIASIGGFIGPYTEVATTSRCDTATAQAQADGCCEGYQVPLTCAPELWDGDAGKGWTNCFQSEEIERIEECRMLSSGTIDPRTPPCGAPFVGMHNEQCDGGEPTQRCANSSSRVIGFEIYTDPGFFVTVPLVDLP